MRRTPRGGRRTGRHVAAARAPARQWHRRLTPSAAGDQAARPRSARPSTSSRSVRSSGTAKDASCRIMARTDFIVAEAGQTETDSRFPRRGGRPGQGRGAFRYQRQHARRLEGGRRAAGGAAHPRRAPAERTRRRCSRSTPVSIGSRRFTSDQRVLESALDHVEAPFGQTSMYDAVAETARVVATRRIRRRPSSATECRHRADRRHRHAKSSHARTGRRDRERHRRACLYPRRHVAD